MMCSQSTPSKKRRPREDTDPSATPTPDTLHFHVLIINHPHDSNKLHPQ